jgi:acyl-CoA synthetase (AMP-forming)/AMP-acid ligase II
METRINHGRIGHTQAPTDRNSQDCRGGRASSAAADADLPAFASMGELVRRHALEAPSNIALVEGDTTIDYATLDARIDAVAAALRRAGLAARDVIAICAPMSIDYAVVFLGALRAGVAVAPLAPGATRDSLARMLADAQAKLLFASVAVDVGDARVPRVDLDDRGSTPVPAAPAPNPRSFAAWLGAAPAAALVDTSIDPSSAFNIIYSSGTTGEPKGIVQSHAMRWAYAKRAHRFGYGRDVVALVSTPLYSNTTLVVFFPLLAFGGCAVLMPKFDACGWLDLAQRHRVTHAMLVPVQYERLLAHPDFDRTDLSSFRFKFSTSAPFPAATKRQAIERWPGELVEFYGSTEGGGSCILEASRHPDKLHTVGRPAPGHELRLIDEAGRELPRDADGRYASGATGEIVGRSPSMMTAYHGKPEATRDVEWFCPQGQRFLRSGDVGRFDADGFVELIDRRKDVIISGGFNVYPSDLEAVLRAHAGVLEAAVVGVPSARWGETPVAFVVPHAVDVLDAAGVVDPAALLAWANERLGKTQRLADLHIVDHLPRSSIGKVLKRELRARWGAGST